MMKSVILFRHGKSDWDVPYKKDHDRPLSQRGVQAAKRMGKYLSKIQQVPELILSSTALRAKTTAEIAKNFGKWDSILILERDIYESSLNDLLSILAMQNPKFSLICLVGHEPTFSYFISEMTKTSCDKFPTAAMARIDFQLEDWKELKSAQGTLSWLKKPKELI